ncbi:MAG: FAD-dependent oxidoreductase [Candidatus Rokubacteria bacterium]|nr:FAD-dependent oxidoreductase [Candidatus Rokubacteria bacterium]
MAFPWLFAPVRLGRVTAKNRVMQLATTNNLSDRGRVGDRLIAFYEERAKGGVGSIVTEALAAHASSHGRSGTGTSRGRGGVGAFDREAVAELKRLADTIHRYDVRIFGQLFHGGRQHHATSIPLLWGPSPIACPHSGGVPHEMTHEEIRSVVASLADAAANLREAGFDGVEIHGAQGHLIQEFISGYSNRRTDEYGGRLENRMRLALEIVRAVREACGADFVLGFRLGAEELSPGGITLDEACRVAQMLAATGAVDYLSISVGNFNSIEIHTPDRHYPPLAFIDYPARIKAATPGLPVIACGRVITPERAEEVLARGQADAVGLCRPLLADAEWARKAADGRGGEIRRCISCNQCWGWVVADRPVGCVHNATTGRELEWGASTLTRAARPKRVVVVGGGPSGLEAARVAAERGHRVVLFERLDRLGGAVRLAASIPGHEEIGYVAEFLVGAVERAGVDVRLGVEATVGRVLAERPDAVVVAAGSTPDPEGLGAPIDFPVYTVHEVVRERVPTGRRAVMFDEDGYYPACETAELVARAGTKLYIVTRFWEVGREIPATSRVTTLRALDQLGVELIPNAWFSRVEGRSVVLAHHLTGREWSIEDVDCLIYVGGNRAQDDLHRALTGRVSELYCIGDAYMPRRIADAVGDGHRVGREL